MEICAINKTNKPLNRVFVSNVIMLLKVVITVSFVVKYISTLTTTDIHGSSAINATNGLIINAILNMVNHKLKKLLKLNSIIFVHDVKNLVNKRQYIR